jgi:hypothetical protein
MSKKVKPAVGVGITAIPRSPSIAPDKRIVPEATHKQDKLARLRAIGFKLAGHWKRSGIGIVFELDRNLATACNVLYFFAVDGELMYLGKTINSLQHRMQSYKTPAKSAAKGGSTNIKNNENIRMCLGQEKTVQVFALPDNGLLQYGGFHVNLAAGLEDSLVREL